MESISTSFLQTNPHPLKSSSLIMNPKSQIITPNSSLTTIHHYINKKLKLHPQKTLPNNNQLPLLQLFFNSIDDFICSFMDAPLRPAINPSLVLSQNFAPVNELPPTACQAVGGSLPPSLDGAYIRNGPNPQFAPNGPYHFLDGDGMLHVIKISNGKATFCCRYVSTHKHAVEREIGRPVVPNFFGAFINGLPAIMCRSLLIMARVVTGQLDPVNCGFGTANTSLTLVARRLYALCESDLPYAVKVTPDGDIVTLGRCDFRAPEPFFRMTAHPKTDRVSGDTFAFRYMVGCANRYLLYSTVLYSKRTIGSYTLHGYNITRPFLTLFRINSQGRKQNDVPIHSIKGPTAMHDFAVTENYAIIPDIQIVVNPVWILRGKSPVGVDAAKVPRLGVIPKYAENEKEMWWVDVEGFNMLHCVNAWEEDRGERIRIVASNAASVEHVFEDVGRARLTMEVVTVDVEARTVRRRSVCDRALDFGVINPAYASKKNRYVYAAVIGATALLGVVKLDLSLTEEDGPDCTVASRLYGPGCYGSEPFFVARDPNNPRGEEDDGYLVTYMHDENGKESKFLVMDAKSPTLDIIASVKLPQRVPNGFHGLFVPETDLRYL